MENHKSPSKKTSKLISPKANLPQQAVEIRSKVTTIKLQEETKLRLNKLKEYDLESYDQVLRKILYILNMCRKKPELAKKKLEQIDSSIVREKEYSEDLS